MSLASVLCSGVFNDVRCICLSPNEAYVAVASLMEIRIVPVPSGDSVFGFAVAEIICDLRFSPCSTLLAYGGDGRVLRASSRPKSLAGLELTISPVVGYRKQQCQKEFSRT